jgi:3-deoxy-7-phosphoheptulonate synthase
MATLKLEIVTPEAKVYSEDVDMVTLPGVEGLLGIYPMHVPLMTQVVAGEIIARKSGQELFLAIGDGFAEVSQDRVAILTDMAIKADDIDEARAEDARTRAEARLKGYPPLVFAGEARNLTADLAKVADGKAFLLQGGDCAETFDGATADRIRNRVKTILQMAVVLTYGAAMPVVKMGRMAGQFAKPRSSDHETRDGVTLPAYRGDIVNGYDFTPESRRADPNRILQGYHTAASTLNLIRAFTQGGFADLREVHSWNKGFAENPANKRYETVAKEIDRAIKFMAAAGADFDSLKRVEFYSSHEGLLMDYERPMTRIDSRTGNPYNTSAHFVWIGERTRQTNGAHMDFAKKIKNPIGVKIGPKSTPEDALSLINELNPDNEAGRLTFITRMGAGNIR